MKHHFWILLSILIISCSCTNNASDDHEEVAEGNILSEEGIVRSFIPEVEIGIAQKKDFKNEFFAEGIIKSGHKVDIISKLPVLIHEVRVNNGEKVKKGQLLFVLDSFKLHNRLMQLEGKINQAELEYESLLIDLRINDSILSDKEKELAYVKSGLKTLNTERALLKRELSETKIYAPINGMVTNLAAQAFNYADKYKSMCMLIDYSSLLVEIEVLETQLNQINVGQKIDVVPASNSNKYPGYIHNINPTVESNGLIKLEGKVSKTDRLLLDGMKATVTIKQKVANQLTVPKSSLVKRQGKDVIFLWQNGRAIWRYVEKGAENYELAIIENGLEVGDTIIINGNTNLGHEAPVKRIN